jgi:hypothetical protein
MARGQGVTAVVLLSVLMAGAALVGLMALRAVHPLVSDSGDRTVMIGQRTKAALEREKTLALRAIKELEFDRAMGKVSEEDWTEMSSRLRARATRLMKQLDAAGGYRGQIERDVAERLNASARAKDDAEVLLQPSQAAERICSSCSTSNDVDARFCKNCGTKL